MHTHKHLQNHCENKYCLEKIWHLIITIQWNTFIVEEMIDICNYQLKRKTSTFYLMCKNTGPVSSGKFWRPRPQSNVFNSVLDCGSCLQVSDAAMWTQRDKNPVASQSLPLFLKEIQLWSVQRMHAAWPKVSDYASR